MPVAQRCLGEAGAVHTLGGGQGERGSVVMLKCPSLEPYAAAVSMWPLRWPLPLAQQRMHSMPVLVRLCVWQVVGWHSEQQQALLPATPRVARAQARVLPGQRSAAACAEPLPVEAAVALAAGEPPMLAHIGCQHTMWLGHPVGSCPLPWRAAPSLQSIH